jgi:hypothetical protein
MVCAWQLAITSNGVGYTSPLAGSCSSRPVRPAVSVCSIRMHYELLLFLDIDGVLHPNHCPEEQYFNCCHALCDAIQKTGVGVVISSNWRLHHTYDELLEILPKPISGRIVGTTGVPYVGKHAKYQEIMTFLDDYRGWSEWRALDDSAWEFPTSCTELILCDGTKGVMRPQVEAISSWLTG